MPSRLEGVYDHPSSLDEEGPLAQCLSSLEGVRGLGRVIVIAAATEPGIEHEAEDRVREILTDFPAMDTLVFGPAELGSLQRRLEQLEFADLIRGISLQGYGAVRNIGLMSAAVLGCDEVVFVDDDQVVIDPGFLETAMEGLGEETPKGVPMLAKTGYYTDEQGRFQRNDRAHWSDMFWRQRDGVNEALSSVLAPPRLKRSTIAFGGCLALHSDLFMNVSFDPWVLRGEDMDYVINARMHGADVFLDADWKVVHNPPEGGSEVLRFRQDVFRFIYQHRKIEFAKSQVDLRQVTPRSMLPYPGHFIDSSVSWRAVATALMRSISTAEKAEYLSVAQRVLKDAGEYARSNCQNYFEFQRRWPQMMDRIRDDVALRPMLLGERRVDRSAITGRFPVVRD